MTGRDGGTHTHISVPAGILIRKGEYDMSTEKVMKSFEDLRFRDDFMFGKVMEDPELCREVLECLLQRPVGRLKELETQKEFRYTADGKPIRLDVYNEDSDRIIYDAEMENLNHKSVKSHELPKRSRFYQGSIDVDYMNKGNSYKRLPESDILFICTFDPFKRGLSQYTFRERCDEDTGLLLGDGTVKIFFNCCYQGKDIAGGLRELYDYILTDRAESELTRKIDRAVAKSRKNEVWRTQYMKEWVIIQDAIEEEKERAEKYKEEITLLKEERRRFEEENRKFEEKNKGLEVELERLRLEIERLKASHAAR